MAAATLTADACASVRADEVAGTLAVSSASSSGPLSNLRSLFWPVTEGRHADGESCATWLDRPDERAQQGLALAMRSDARRTTAVTVSRNIAYDVEDVLNVDGWDTTRRPAFHLLTQFNLSAQLVSNQKLDPLPWRVCARLRGHDLAVKLWEPRRQPEPGWENPRFVHRYRLPTSVPSAGQAGWYVGHLSGGTSVHYADLASW